MRFVVKLKSEAVEGVSVCRHTVVTTFVGKGIRDALIETRVLKKSLKNFYY